MTPFQDKTKPHALSLFDLDRTLLKINSSLKFSLSLNKRHCFDFPLLHCFWSYFRYQFCGLSLKGLHHYAFEKILKGRNIEELQAQADIFLLRNLQNSLYHPALKYLYLAQQHNHHIVLLSSSPTFIVEPIAKILGIANCYATQYQCNEKGVLSEISQIVDGDFKVKIALQLKNQLELDHDSIFAYSDSIFDLELLEIAGHPSGVNPDRQLKRICKNRGWKII